MTFQALGQTLHLIKQTDLKQISLFEENTKKEIEKES